MATSKAKKRSNNMKRKKQQQSNIKSLPRELVVEIMGKVASRSIVDLCKAKLTCKEFLHASEDNVVYQHASLDKFALVPLPWFSHDKKQSTFLKRCKENGNLEILYREGMVQYFTSCLNSGLDNLKKAALEGHIEAKYVYSMLLMFGISEESEDGEQAKREQGFHLFCSLKSTTCVARCRKRVKSYIRSMWVNNNHVFQKRHFSLCCSNTCDKNVRQIQLKHSRRWSSLVEDEDDDVIGVSCDYCDADYELDLFRNMFKV